MLWILGWFKDDYDARDVLLYDVQSSLLGAAGRKKTGELCSEAFDEISSGMTSWLTGLLAYWLTGNPLKEIELALGGEPDAKAVTKQVCPRARELVSSVIPRGLSFIMGLVTRIVTEVDPYKAQESLTPEVIEVLSTAVRLGYDSPEKLSFSLANPNIMSRVGVHREFTANQ